MIVLNLSCRDGHRFEGWFASRDAFDDQVSRGLVNCAHCQIAEVSALPSGPRVLRSHDARPVAQMPEKAPDVSVLAGVFRMLAQAARTAEDVGTRFPEEARRIHYDEVPARTIRGIATADEALELLEEGIAVLPALVPPESETH